ncbi:SH3 domain-containing protein [Halomonas sp. McH1-25]|uniref:TIGR04211 family SH3 domain-containing protein n=1 Tax=unclassified Halomonas TaxID=2609666 RepID=UPI001EF60A75|nr:MULTISPECIES: TIGR04211 family SH3 domain-containing protein [unclassified Halomonas]MCG7602003.1 SH3 domain-containing protein [Halomonas sp. McH1-25]MCP1341556.1 TIGR04211 family SH3 domain-containing protein [Halomonas sp. FL8]MCP1360202.1 TIGR04211 family SH3 domain-containing protein [Halomonas sp. BBD45]MCP1365748.1 TIGR04211 family SH3 domain-containing protein [Halomonas sp. BBD48]
MRKIKYLFACLTLSLAALDSQAQDVRWVADDLETYVRSGPTNEYRIVGTLTSGDEVTVLETQGDYTRVRAPNGDEVWIESDQLQAERSVSDRVPELQARTETLSARLEGIDEEWQSRVATMTETLKQREARIAELERRNAELNQQTSQAEDRIRGLQARLDTQEQDLLMRYFMYGGGVAGAGLIVGLLVPHLPRRRNKRDRWF